MFPKYLIVDSSCVLMANYYVQRKYAEEAEISAEYLADITIRAVYNLLGKLGLYETTVVLVHDIGKSFRYNLYDDYKSGRPEHNHYKSIKLNTIKHIGEKSNFINFGIDTLEADDLGYLLSSQFTDSWFVSNDNDWKTVLCFPAQRFYKYKGSNLESWFDISGINWEFKLAEPIMEKILLGCKSDTISSIITKKKFKLIDWNEVPEEKLWPICSGGSIDYSYFILKVLPNINEENLQVLIDKCRFNQILTTYTWLNYVNNVKASTLMDFKNTFKLLFNKEFNEGFA